ncbi:hypothetical protein [Pleionea mediterranea]|uniref:Uncharacterized protein n=1 Tax=Pleionea mediterranea TaxID=523701 RepID=A0A316FY86_9GAMM|nr:hypothetical protein [Pleionea mediterranea]PWK53065.1 hypothetical protein C8D97_104283 [Pleionea mediterranea]
MLSNPLIAAIFFIGSSVLLIGCTDQHALNKYKQTYKQGLIKLCGEAKDCKELIEQRFDQCLDESLVRDMIAAKPEEQEQLNKNIVEKTMACIVEYAEKESNLKNVNQI